MDVGDGDTDPPAELASDTPVPAEEPDSEPIAPVVLSAPVSEWEMPAEISDEIRHRAIWLVGFDTAGATDMQRVLGAAGATTHVRSRSQVEIDLALHGIDLALVSLDDGDTVEGWQQASALARRGIGVLCAGSPCNLVDGKRHRGGCELLVRPWTDEELLLRCFQLIRSATPPETSTDRDRKPGDKHQVVLADDDVTITTLVAATLREMNVECHIAAGGEDALELIRNVRPSAAVLDVNMPQLDGFEVLAEIRNNADTRDLPVIMLTALRQEADVVRGFRLGAHDHVSKPFNPRELSARLERLLRALPDEQDACQRAAS